MSTLRLALVGAGRMGAMHAAAVAGESDGIELAAVVDPSAEAVARLPIDARRCAHTDELLTMGGIDGAIVAVPTRLHAEVAGRLLDAGLPVLCEKPCGMTSGETRGLAARAVAAGVPLHVGYWRRFVPTLRSLRERIASGDLGELALVHCAQWDELPPPAAFRDPASSGGIVVDMGVHELDQLRWLTGQEIASIQGVSSGASFDPPVDGDPEGVVLALGLDGGAAAVVTLLRRHPPGDLCRVEVVATRGAVRLDFVAPPDSDEAFLEALRAQVCDFADAIRGKNARAATPDDAIRALEAAERAREVLSARAG